MYQIKADRELINVCLIYLTNIKKRKEGINMKHNKLYGTTFCGNEASDYAKKYGYLDYATLAKAFDCVLNNNIIKETWGLCEWEQENGYIDNSDAIEELEEKINELDIESTEYYENNETEKYTELREKIDSLYDKIEELRDEEEESYNAEIFQYFIISYNGAEILKDWTDEIVYYNELLDMYVWGVTHWGTGWDYVLTDIKLNCGEEAFDF